MTAYDCKPYDCDALVIGGGPGGGTAALLLARAGWSVTLVERKRFPRRKVCGEYLSGTNWPLFQQLDLTEAFSDAAGPAVDRVGLLAGHDCLTAPLPLPPGVTRWGRALSRERLDQLLLERGQQAGVRVLQPYSAESLERDGDGHRCRVEPRGGEGAAMEIRARTVVAAHGSWETGDLPTQASPAQARPGDLFGFKAHFQGSGLPAGLMPLLTFPDGYGGMVHADRGRVSLSCCIRRDRLDRLPRAKGESAGEAVLEHLRQTCPAIRAFVDGAEREGAWLASGPIRPGIRARHAHGVFLVGNAAGEAHPVVAEGISIAMQSAWLLADELLAQGPGRDSREARRQAVRGYSQRWHQAFASRIRAAAAFAHWAMRPAAVSASLPVLRRFPAILTWGAGLSGKSRRVVS